MADQTPEKELIVEQYKSLRAEIHMHINVQYTTLGFTFIIIGAVMTIAVQGQIGPPAFLIYPILALFPALIWEANEVAIAKLAIFLREQFEPCMDSTFRWEKWLREERLLTLKKEHSWSGTDKLLYLWGIRGVFLGSQVLMLCLAFYTIILQYEKYKSWVMLGIEAITSVIAVPAMCWILMDRNKEKEAVMAQLKREMIDDAA